MEAGSFFFSTGLRKRCAYAYEQYRHSSKGTTIGWYVNISFLHTRPEILVLPAWLSLLLLEARLNPLRTCAKWQKE